MASYPSYFIPRRQGPVSKSQRQRYIDGVVGRLTQGGSAVAGLRILLGVDFLTAAQLYTGEKPFTEAQLATLQSKSVLPLDMDILRTTPTTEVAPPDPRAGPLPRRFRLKAPPPPPETCRFRKGG